MSKQRTENLLSVSHLATGYGDLRVVWDVSLEAYPGQITTILGRNGAGKTTTLRAIAGLNRIHDGSVDFDGASIVGMKAHRRVANGISYVQEGKRVFRRQTVIENLLLGGYTVTTRKKALRPELERVFELFPILKTKRNDPAGSLSGGQQQMVAIGQALMASPRLLMIDEPSGGLAPSIVAEVMARIGELKHLGIAIVLVEQTVDAALAVADHVVVLEVGKVVIAAPIAEIDPVEVENACIGAA